MSGESLLNKLLRDAFAKQDAGEMVVSGKTRSMHPQLRAGDVICWERLGEFASGSIIVFHRAATDLEEGSEVEVSSTESLRKVLAGQQLIVHRLIRRNADGTLLTKGDARPGFDKDVVDPEDVIGVVRSYRRAHRQVSLVGRKSGAYATVVTAISDVGGTLYPFAESLDHAFGRVFGLGERLFFRRMTDIVQKIAQRTFHLLCFRWMHRTTDAS